MFAFSVETRMGANGVEALHFWQAIWSRQWWLIYTLGFGAIGECIGVRKSPSKRYYH